MRNSNTIAAIVAKSLINDSSLQLVERLVEAFKANEGLMPYLVGDVKMPTFTKEQVLAEVLEHREKSEEVIDVVDWKVELDSNFSYTLKIDYNIVAYYETESAAERKSWNFERRETETHKVKGIHGATHYEYNV